MNSALKTLTLAAVGGTFAFAGAAQAASVADLIFGNAATDLDNLDDFSVEFVVDNNNTPDTLDVNDVIRGAFTIDNINGQSTSAGNPADNDQMTGVFSLRVESVTPIIGDPLGRSTIVFGHDSGFDSWASTTLGLDGPAVAVGDPIVRFFSRPSNVAGPDFQLSGDANTNVATAGGNFLFDLGFGGASEVEGWIAEGGTDLATARTLGTGVEFGEGRFALSLLADELGLIVDPQVLSAVDPFTAAALGVFGSGLTAEFWGVSTVNGAGGTGSGFADNGFDLTDNTDINFVAVPTPAAAVPALAMIGLLGLGRRRSKD